MAEHDQSQSLNTRRYRHSITYFPIHAPGSFKILPENRALLIVISRLQLPTKLLCCFLFFPGSRGLELELFSNASCSNRRRFLSASFITLLLLYFQRRVSLSTFPVHQRSKSSRNPPTMRWYRLPRVVKECTLVKSRTYKQQKRNCSGRSVQLLQFGFRYTRWATLVKRGHWMHFWLLLLHVLPRFFASFHSPFH